MGVLLLAIASSLFVTPDQLKWSEYAAKGWPPGSATAVVTGDPTKPCGWVLRYRMPDGYRVPVHTDPAAEAATVLTGTYIEGVGDVADRARAREYPVGSYMEVDRNVPHYGWAVGETILEVRPLCNGK